MRFPRHEHQSGLPFPSSGDLPDPEIEPSSPALADGFFTPEPLRKPKAVFVQSTLKSSWSCGAYRSGRISMKKWSQGLYISCMTPFDSRIYSWLKIPVTFWNVRLQWWEPLRKLPLFILPLSSTTGTDSTVSVGSWRFFRWPGNLLLVVTTAHGWFRGFVHGDSSLWFLLCYQSFSLQTWECLSC